MRPTGHITKAATQPNANISVIIQTLVFVDYVSLIHTQHLFLLPPSPPPAVAININQVLLSRSRYQDK